MAVIEFVPFVRLDVVSVATPLEIGALPKTTVPAENFTCSPFGGLLMIEVTVAVKVTGWPMFDGFGDEVSDVFVVGVRRYPVLAPEETICPVALMAMLVYRTGGVLPPMSAAKV